MDFTVFSCKLIHLQLFRKF